LGGPDERFGIGIVPVQAGFDAKQAEADGASVIRPKKRSTRLIDRLHEVNLASGFAVAFTDLRTGEAPESRSPSPNAAHPDAERARIASTRPFSFEDRRWRPGDAQGRALPVTPVV
jgi:hypothetical protein